MLPPEAQKAVMNLWLVADLSVSGTDDTSAIVSKRDLGIVLRILRELTAKEQEPLDPTAKLFDGHSIQDLEAMHTSMFNGLIIKALVNKLKEVTCQK